MDRSPADHRRAVARRTGSGIGNLAARLCDRSVRAILLSDRASGRRDLAASEEGANLRQLQVVADLLSPFAGPRAAELAERLIGKFGSLGRALSADPDRIGDADLAEACRIVHAARRLTESALREKLDG